MNPPEADERVSGEQQHDLREALARAFMAQNGLSPGARAEEWDRDSPDAYIHLALDDADVAIRVFRDLYPEPLTSPGSYWFLKDAWERELRRSIGVQLILFADEMERSERTETSQVVREIGSRILKSEI